jgi:ubiquitin-like-conjugating enzyme ATG3
MDFVGHKLGNAYRSIVGAVKSLPTESTFLESGKLTPEEFLIAGEQLVHRCPTWSWSSSVSGHEQKHFPPDKQFLITRGVPCRKRVKNIEESKSKEEETEEGWVVAESFNENENIDEVYIKNTTEVIENLENDEILDMDQVTEDLVVEKDENAIDFFSNKNYIAVDEPEENILKTRVYDLSITYDVYYQTPRLWLVGYDEYKRPLKTNEMFEDIMEDYAKKTATSEEHPCLGAHQISIHPCNHAKMMKHFIDILGSNGSVAQVHHSLFVFLKFLSSVVPTIEYDFTVDLSLD